MNIINDIIKLRKPVITYGKGKSNLYVCTFQEIFEFSNALQLPEIQGDLNMDKVEEMCNSYKLNHHFMASKALLTIARIEIANQIDYCLLDGQHRLEMIKKIYDSEKISDDMIIAFINIKSKEELNDLFLEINIDSSKCVYKNLTIFDKQNYEELKKKIEDDNSLHPLINSRYTSKVYTNSQFVAHLINNKILEKLRENNLTGNNVDSILDFLKLKEREFFNKYRYDSKKLDKSKDFNNDEKEQINFKSCMFIKNNNFLDWIFDSDLEPEHDFNKRPDINPKLRNQVWDKHIGRKNKSSRCPIANCKNIMTANDSDTWHCGHILSFHNGGPTDITNLKPICPLCNKKMNYKNWDEWEEEQKNNFILDKYFKENKKIGCKNDDCNMLISKKNYKIVSSDDNSMVPWCEKCYNNLHGIENTKSKKEVDETNQEETVKSSDIIINVDNDIFEKIKKYNFQKSEILECKLNNKECGQSKWSSVIKHLYENIIKNDKIILTNAKLNVKEGKIIDKGFTYITPLKISFQKADANKSLNEIVNQTIVNKIKLYLKIKLDDGNVCIIERHNNKKEKNVLIV